MEGRDPSPDKAQSNRYLKFTNTMMLTEENDEDEKQTAPKRRVSCDQSKTIKRPEMLASPRRPTQSLESKVNYKISSDVISFEMEEQRCIHMKIIEQNEQLKAYYIAFKKMFINLFQASHFLMENMFRLSLEMYQNKHVVFLCLLFELPKAQWKIEFLSKMMTLAKNIIYMASTPNQFERRIDLVTRKVTLQNEKREKIKNAFLNPKIQRAWEISVQPHFQDEQTEVYIEDQFETPQEKMCFIEIKDFVVKRLSTQSFGNQLRKYGALEQIDEDISLDFKFQFLLTEQLSFNAPQVLKKEVPKPVEQKVNQQVKADCVLM